MAVDVAVDAHIRKQVTNKTSPLPLQLHIRLAGGQHAWDQIMARDTRRSPGSPLRCADAPCRSRGGADGRVRGLLACDRRFR